MQVNTKEEFVMKRRKYTILVLIVMIEIKSFFILFKIIVNKRKYIISLLARVRSARATMPILLDNRFFCSSFFRLFVVV